MGQGISTALPAAVADELEADWDRVTVKQGEGVDTKIPGLKYGAIIHCPVFEGKLISVDSSDALAMPGVEKVVEIPRFDVPYGSIGGVAVVKKQW